MNFKNIYNGNYIEKYRVLLLFFIILLALFIQIHDIDKSLWRDEFYRLSISSLDLRSILASPDEVHPPLYYIILHFVLYLGKSEFIIRLPSLIFSILCVPLVYKLGKDLFSFPVGLLSALLFATSPEMLWHAQDANMYTLFLFFSLLSILFFYNALHSNDFRLWILFIVSSALNLYTHYFAFLILLIEGLFLILFIKEYSWKKLEKFLISIIVIFLLFIPQLVNFLSGFIIKISEHSGVLWGFQPTILFPKTIIFDLFFGDYIWWGWDSIILAVGIMAFIIFIFGLIISYNEYKEATVLSTIWIFIPILIAFFLAFRINIVSRYLIFVLPVYLIVISKGLITIKKSQVLVFLTLLVILLASNAVFINKIYESPFEDWKASTAYLKENINSEDAIVFFPIYHETYYQYYGLNHSGTWDLNNSLPWDINGQELIGVVEGLCQNNSRVWISYFPYSVPRDDKQEILDWLTPRCTLKNEVTNIKLYLCENCSYHRSVENMGS